MSQTRRLASREAQAGQVKFSMLRITQEVCVCDHDRGDGAQPLDDLACVLEPTHLRIAGGKIAIRNREAGILLDRQEQVRHCLIEPPT